MIHAGVGVSKQINNSKEAGAEAILVALKNIAGLPAPVASKPAIVFAFASIQYNQKDVLAGIREVVPEAIVLGGSAAGEITSAATVFDGVAAMAIISDQIQFSVGIGRGVNKNSFKAGADAASAVVADNGNKTPDLYISLPDGMTGNGAAIVQGAQSVLGKNFPMIGGSMGDDYLFKQTWEYYAAKNKPAEVATDAVVGVGLTGAFSFGFGIKHGWEPVGLPMKVTKSSGTLLQEVDGKPALEIYQDYFGKEAAELVKEPLARMAYTYPLGLSVEGSDELLIRDPVIANEKGEITMAAAIPEGTTIRLMIGDREKAIHAAKDAATNALSQLKGHEPRLVLMFNCMARNKLLGVRCSEENQAVQDIMGREVPMLGFYTYGEQGPLLGKKGTPAYFHNETMTILVIGE